MNKEKQLVVTGRVWKFGDNINTDLIMPTTAFRLPQKERHKLVFSAIRPGWADQVRFGDLVIGGVNFGMGSSRPVGALLKSCGIAGLVADSVNGLCLRSCINAGMLGIDCPKVTTIFEEGEVARVNYLKGTVENLTRPAMLQGRPLSLILAEIALAGGVIDLLISEGYIELNPTNAAST